MISSFYDLSMIQYNNGIAVADRRKPVGNDKYSPSLHQVIHTSEEVLDIASTERVWKYLVKVLAALKA